MKLIISPHNLTLTEAIEDHVRSRIVTLEHDKTKAPEKAFKCAILLRMPGPDLYAEDHEDNLYAAIDLVTKKVQQQIRKVHSKQKAKNHSEAARLKEEQQAANL
jgi:putative sigma-54 modulation protein